MLSPPHGGDITVTARPVPNLTLAINHALGGYDVWGYHALNLAVHILAGLTLLGIVRRTLLLPRFRDRFRTTADELSLAVAILWVVHPLADRVRDVYHPADRVAHGLVLSPHAVLFYSRRGGGTAVAMARLLFGSVRYGNGEQRSDGFSAFDGPALRSDISGRIIA